MEKDEKTHGAVVETYAEAMAQVLENDKEGLVRKIIHGEEKQKEEKERFSPEAKKNKVFMILGIIFTVLAVGTLSFFLLKKDANIVSVPVQFKPLIFNDQLTYLEISGLKKEEIAQAISNEVSNTKVKIGGVEGIYLTENKQVVGLRRFITLIKGNFAPSSNPFFISDNFLMGAVNNNFFMLVKMRETADIFDSLRAWENKMFFDMDGFLGISIDSSNNYLLTKNFTDCLIENKNARCLYDKNNQIVLMYIFADSNSIIITGSQAAAHEVMLRLSGSQATQ
jgi:hypothetical protein